MAVELSKGDVVSLEKATITAVHAGLGWDMNEGADGTADLDLFMIQLDGAGKATDKDLIFYNAKMNENRSAYVGEDNLTGEGDGYDEEAWIKLNEVPETVNSIIIAASIYHAAEKHQNFAGVKSAFCDINNDENQEKLAGYDLTSEMGSNTAITIGQFTRTADGWDFTALGEGFTGGMAEVVTKYGINVA